VLAIFGGLALDALLGSSGRSFWRTAAVAAVFVYGLLYAGTVDALMLNDSRYAAEEWMRDHIGRGDLVGVSGPMELLPRIHFPYANVSSLAVLDEARPKYYVLNAEYAHTVSQERPWGQLIAALQTEDAGYERVYRHRSGSPWPWLPGAHPDLRDDRQ